MVEEAHDVSQLARRLRDRYSTDEESMAIARDIIEKKLKIWRVPTLHEVKLLGKTMLMKILFYCPESDYFYDDEETMNEMVQKWTRPQVF